MTSFIKSKGRGAAWVMGLCVFVFVFASPLTAHAQYGPTTVRANPYSNYYTNRSTVGVPRRTWARSSARYTYDRVFYRSAAVSPYSNMARPGNYGATGYQTWVRPEANRRLNATISGISPQRRAQFAPQIRAVQATKLGHSPQRKPPARVTRPSSYYNRYYGGRAALGLQ